MGEKNKIKIFSTGGTIDGYLSVNNKPKDSSEILGLIESARISSVVTYDSVIKKDSRDITEEDRSYILKCCQECNEQHVLITHGTITMTKTAEFLGKNIVNKTVVLVGSAIPAKEKNSDAEFNFGAAVMALTLAPTGVYIAMNGKLFNWDNVQKNKDTGFFEEKY